MPDEPCPNLLNHLKGACLFEDMVWSLDLMLVQLPGFAAHTRTRQARPTLFRVWGHQTREGHNTMGCLLHIIFVQ